MITLSFLFVILLGILLNIHHRFMKIVFPCVLTGLQDGQYDLIMICWISKPWSGVATYLDSVSYR